MRHTLAAFVGCGLMCMSGLAQAADLLEKFMSDPRPAQALFTQTDKQGVSKGEVALGNQGKIRWSQTAPYKSLLVSNGKVAWQVDPDLMQATRLSPSMTEGWAGVFGNRKSLEKNYALEQKGQRLTLTPKHKEGTKGTIDFDLNGNPIRVRFEQGPLDRNKNAFTEIRFAKWTRLKPTSTSIFDYTPTAGMDIINAN